MITAILNQKGGTGKTTTTVNLGCALAIQQKKVLLIDLDPQANLTFHFGIKASDYTIANLIDQECQIEDCIIRKEGLDIIPAHISLANTELNLVSVQRREYVLSDLISQLNYDYILIDCPPSLSLLTVNALTAADEVLVPIIPEVLSIKGLDLILDTVTSIRNNLNERIIISGILPVMLDQRKKLSNEVLDYVSQNYDIPLFSTHIRTNVKASEAPSFGSSVMSYDSKSNSAIDYKNLALELINRTTNELIKTPAMVSTHK